MTHNALETPSSTHNPTTSDTSRLKPCLFCCATDAIIVGSGLDYQVECQTPACISGPLRATPEAAAEAWNARPLSAAEQALQACAEAVQRTARARHDHAQAEAQQIDQAILVSLWQVYQEAVTAQNDVWERYQIVVRQQVRSEAKKAVQA